MSRYTLRPVMLGIAVTIALLDGPAPMAAEIATEAMKSTIVQVLHILRDQEFKGPGGVDARRQQLEQVIGSRLAYHEIAKRSLGAQWKELNDEERQEFVRLFAQLLRNTFASRLEEYSDEEVHFLREKREGSYAEVSVKLTGSKVATDLDFRLLNRAGDWRVYDVIADGVSLIHSYREQFMTIIRKTSYAELVAKLKQKSGELTPFVKTTRP